MYGLSGDSNLDNEVDILDIIFIISYIVGEDNLNQDSICNSDFNSDFNIDVLDIVLIVNNILSN